MSYARRQPHKNLRDIELASLSSPELDMDPESHPSHSPSSPLLPTYSPPRSSSLLQPHHQPTPSGSGPSALPSPFQAQQRRRERRRLAACGRLLRCVLIALLILVPSFGWAACYGGERALGALQQLADQGKLGDLSKVPEEWRGWLEGVVASLHGGAGSVSPGGEHGEAQDPMFPTNVGYAGSTPTGSEAFLLATAPSPPMHTHVSPLLPPSSFSSLSGGFDAGHDSVSKGKGKGQGKPVASKFSIIQHWGHLSPYFSVLSHGLPESSSLIPHGCELQRVIWLQRHGARYPTTETGGPAGLGARLKAAKVGKGWTASGALDWLNEWEYKLGAEVLTPFGRQQLFNLGTAARLKYGHLLDKMDGRKPVLRTESQDRMLKSAQNFAAGFFGIPAEDQYHLEVTIEAAGFNNTLAPWGTCNDDSGFGRVAWSKQNEWNAIFLADAIPRLQAMISGYEVTLRDARAMMDTCAYETVALGYSAFCDLFTRKEWRAYGYSMDIWWWYGASFGYPKARAQGKGWAEELLSRLSKTRITDFDSSINSTFHNDVQFPLDDPLTFDFTHDTEFAMLLPTLNLTSFARSGPPPTDHMPKGRSFIASQFTPFATNLQFQVLSCPAATRGGLFGSAASSQTEDKIRLILNDAPVPLTGMRGCPEDKDGMCGLETYIAGLRQVVHSIDWEGECGARAVQEQDAQEDEEAEEGEQAEAETDSEMEAETLGADEMIDERFSRA